MNSLPFWSSRDHLDNTNKESGAQSTNVQLHNLKKMKANVHRP